LSGLKQCVPDEHFDVAWVDSGRYVGPSAVRWLSKLSGGVISIVADDPFGKRDRYSWTQYLRTIPEYDLVVVVREVNVSEAYARGAKNVLRVFFAADEIAHAPRPVTQEQMNIWGSDVSFVGTWFPERGPFAVELMERGVPLSIFGNRWDRDPQWNRIKSAWRGPGTQCDEDYAAAILCAKVSLGLLSVGNRDMHTTRSLEIPSLGGVLCAERSKEHEALYVDGEEAVFWSNADECAAACRRLLENEPLRRQIAQRGHARALQNGHFNEPMVANIIDKLLSKSVKITV
jgi:spore maturation protein CgeB